MASVRRVIHRQPRRAAAEYSKDPSPKETHTRGKKEERLSCFFSFDASLFRWGAEFRTHTTKGGNPKVRRTWIEYTPSLETKKTDDNVVVFGFPLQRPSHPESIDWPILASCTTTTTVSSIKYQTLGRVHKR